MPAWSEPLESLYNSLHTDEHGLSSTEAAKGLEKYGPNELKREKRISPIALFLGQFADFLMIVLIVATLISFAVGQLIDATIILIFMFFNAGFGAWQEWKAERAIEALARMAALRAVVLRGGVPQEIPVAELVPGDVVLLEEGSKVPADCRLVETINLQADESMLTGESIPVDKRTGLAKPDAHVTAQRNMAFSGTIIVRGHGKGLVVATGMATEIGRIAKEVEVPSPPTPLQTYLGKFSRRLGLGIAGLSALVFVLGVAAHGPVLQTFLTAVSLAVAAIPESLLAVVTLSLALGVRRMASKKALVRRLPAVEALGSATVICTDKTGTLTENRMTVQKVYADGKITDIAGTANDMLFRTGLLCNNATEAEGDPTEKALVASARNAGLNIAAERKKWTRIKEIPFSSAAKRMTTIHEMGGERWTFMKGAPAVVLERCGHYIERGKVHKLTPAKRAEIMDAERKMAHSALRVLAFAYKEGDREPEQGLTFVGIQGMLDPPRKEVKAAVAQCETAGIRVVMVTGDHALTAAAIARQIGLKGDHIVTGDELGRMSDSELRKAVKRTNIFARVDPEHKIRIVNALRAQGEIVAVTGDGVNDAPSLKIADTGVAMGIRGTDVAKEASDIVITDDNFATIVAAIGEGRRIFDNIRKFVNYLLSCNLAEVLIVLIASLAFLPLPLTAVQLLWLNLLTDGAPALALGVDPARRGIMRAKPRPPGEGLVNGGLFRTIIQNGVLITAACLALYVYVLGQSGSAKAQTMVFTSLVLFELVRLQSIRYHYKQGLLTNRWLAAAVIISLGLQLAVLYGPLAAAFDVVPLGLYDWALMGGVLAAAAAINHVIQLFRAEEI